MARYDERDGGGCSGCLPVLLIALLIDGAVFYGVWCLLTWALG